MAAKTMISEFVKTVVKLCYGGVRALKQGAI